MYSVCQACLADIPSWNNSYDNFCEECSKIRAQYKDFEDEAEFFSFLQMCAMNWRKRYEEAIR